MIKAVTIDLGCTLVFESSCIGEEPSNVLRESMKALSNRLKRLGYDVKLEDLFKALNSWGHVRSKYFSECIEFNSRLRIYYILKYLGITPKPDIVEELLRIMINAAVNTRKLYSDVVEFLKELRKYNLKLALISNASSHEDVLETLKHFRIIKYFDLVLSSNISVYKKPVREIFEMATELLDVRPEESIHLGDSLADIYGALSAGYATAIEIARHKECITRLCVKDLREALAIIKKYLK